MIRCNLYYNSKSHCISTSILISHHYPVCYLLFMFQLKIKYIRYFKVYLFSKFFTGVFSFGVTSFTTIDTLDSPHLLQKDLFLVSLLDNSFSKYLRCIFILCMSTLFYDIFNFLLVK